MACELARGGVQGCSTPQGECIYKWNFNSEGFCYEGSSTITPDDVLKGDALGGGCYYQYEAFISTGASLSYKESRNLYIPFGEEFDMPGYYKGKGSKEAMMQEAACPLTKDCESTPENKRCPNKKEKGKSYYDELWGRVYVNAFNPNGNDSCSAAIQAIQAYIPKATSTDIAIYDCPDNNVAYDYGRYFSNDNCNLCASYSKKTQMITEH